MFNQRRITTSIEISESEKPGQGWDYVLEIHTMKRYYRLFSDSYDTKEQWFNVLKQIMLAKERMEED